jgi:hypothetical protein
VLCWVIAPFLLLAFAVLYPWPSDTGRLFAWRIQPAMSAMVLGAAYVGGAYFFVRAGLADGWHTIKAGFPPVALFAGLLGIATVLHWNKFSHTHVAFWLWVTLYFTTPWLVLWVWLCNRSHDAPPSGREPMVPIAAARVIALVGWLAVITGFLLFAFPAKAIAVWPWPMTPLTARVMGAVLCLGLAGTGSVVDRRWSSARLAFQVAELMLVLLIGAGIRAAGEFDTTRVLTWLFAFGFPALAFGLFAVDWRMRREQPRTGLEP